MMLQEMCTCSTCLLHTCTTCRYIVTVILYSITCTCTWFNDDSSFKGVQIICTCTCSYYYDTCTCSYYYDTCTCSYYYDTCT